MLYKGASAEIGRETTSEWKSTACILCECKCGIEVQLGGADGRRLVKVRGDEDRDWVAGTPWHKHTPARVEAL